MSIFDAYQSNLIVITTFLPFNGSFKLFLANAHLDGFYAVLPVASVYTRLTNQLVTCVRTLIAGEGSPTPQFEGSPTYSHSIIYPNFFIN